MARGSKGQHSRAGQPADERVVAVNYWPVATLFSAVLLSAFAVIHSSHQCRQLYTQLQELEALQWHLHEDFSRLLLEQSTWASYYRVEKVARDELKMGAPDLTEMKVVLE